MWKKLKVRFFERIYMRGAWAGFRDVIEGSVVPGGGGVALIGDSLTHLGRWELLFPGMGVSNFGIGGERTEHILLRLDPIIALRPRQAFLLIGTNDLGYDEPVDEIAQRLDQIVGSLAEALPDCRLHVQGVMPRERSYADSIRQLNQRYEEVARRRGVAFIPLFDLFADADGQLRKELTDDGIHLRGAGYRVWRDALSPWIKPQP